MKLHFRLIALLAVFVPGRLRDEWRREWEGTGQDHSGETE
jgi:hypothetical protein